MPHTCHATACNARVPPEMWGCKRHWFMVPKPIRDRIWASYRPGQCDDWKPSRAYLEAAREAVITVAAKEGIEPDTRLYDRFLERFESSSGECTLDRFSKRHYRETMKTRAQVIEERRKKAEAEAAAAKETPKITVTSSALVCKSCSAQLDGAAVEKATRRADGTLECPECGGPLAGADASPAPIPEPKKSAADRPPKATLPLPPCFCITCGAEWLRVDEMPMPNCGHTDGFVHDRSQVKNLKPPAGHPIVSEEEKAAHAAKKGLVVADVRDLPPGAKLVGYGGGGGGSSYTVGAGGASSADPPPFNPKRPPEQPVPPPSLVRVGNMLFAAWGKMTFRVGDFGQNISIGPFEISVEIAPDADVIIAGARLTQQMRQLADTAFAEQLAWYMQKVGIIEKKLGGG